MCPDPQLLSIYMDREMPSPWKEKMEKHLSECSACREKFNNFKHLQELFKKDTQQQRKIVELAERAPLEQELMESAKEKVWKRLASRRRLSSGNMWRRRFSISLPAAAAAAVVIMLLTVLGLRIGLGTGSFAGKSIYTAEKASFILEAEEEMPDIMPVADINSVLQFLRSNGSEIIIIQLPESRSFNRAGEPTIVREADYNNNNRRRYR